MWHVGIRWIEWVWAGWVNLGWIRSHIHHTYYIISIDYPPKLYSYSYDFIRLPGMSLYIGIDQQMCVY